MSEKKLKSYRKLVRKCEDLEKRIKEKDNELTRIKSPQMSDMPVLRGKSFDDLIIKVAELKEAYHSKYLAALRLCQEIENAIDGLEDEDDQLAARLYYIDGLPWWKVALKIPCGEAEIYRKRKEILNKLTA